MNHMPSLDSIEEQLSHALRQFMAVPEIDRQVISVPLSSGPLERAVKNMLERKNEWLTIVPALQDVQKWVEVHWNTERQTQRPAGTVSTRNEGEKQGEVQLDTLTATCKLFLAAARHGAKSVAKYAMEFSAYGMIEIRSFYLLKGISVSNTKSLDNYCTLLPYRKALQKVNADPSMRRLAEELLYWPPESADNVCMLEARSFERRDSSPDGQIERCVSRLLQCGRETLALILGLVWGTGFRVFGQLQSIAEPVAAALPFFYTSLARGGNIQQTLLTLPGSNQPSMARPLNDEELVKLIDKYAGLPGQTQRVLNLALRRLRDSAERIEIEDKVIDVCIALEALFMERKERKQQRKLISKRGSWYFADSCLERKKTKKLLKKFYDHRSDIVHGNTPRNQTPAKEEQYRKQLSTLLADTENVVRASLKTMIAKGRSQDWPADDLKSIFSFLYPSVWLRLIRNGKKDNTLYHNPPRAETEIPSVKSDSSTRP